MSAYENVIGGKLKLKGKALDVKAGGVKKKKKHKKKQEDEDRISQLEDQPSEGIYKLCSILLNCLCKNICHSYFTGFHLYYHSAWQDA